MDQSSAQRTPPMQSNRGETSTALLFASFASIDDAIKDEDFDMDSDCGTLNPGQSPEPESGSELVIGIDFGTTFTGVAYAHSLRIASVASFSDMKMASQQITIVQSWPSQTPHFSSKIPTLLSYANDPPAWGGAVDDEDPFRVAHFKLGLQESVARHYAHGLGASFNESHIHGGYLTDDEWKHSKLPEKSALDFTTDFLAGIVKFLKTEFLPGEYGGTEFLINQRIPYVITVPAIWSDKAKSLTQQAAVAAGIPQKDLMLITEPEAAAHFCISLCKDTDLKEGEKFLVCDAGGGTVDLISYRVVAQSPFVIEECSVGTGGACGALDLDRRFQNLVKDRLEQGNSLKPKFVDQMVQFLLLHFGSSIKRQFNPLNPSAKKRFIYPVNLEGDHVKSGIKNGYFEMTKDELTSVFDPVFEQIWALISQQIEAVRETDGSELKTLFLVGGLGANGYLRMFLEARLKGLVQVRQGGYDATMKGAVLYRLGMHLVRERVLRSNYGTIMDMPFRWGVHPKERRFRHMSGQTRCRGLMYWFAHKGQKLATGNIVKYSFNKSLRAEEYLTPGPLKWVDTLWVCGNDTPPQYDGDPSIRKHCTLEVDLRKIPERGFHKGVSKQGEYYTTNFELGLVFSGGGIEFRFLSQGNVLGTANCAYF